MLQIITLPVGPGQANCYLIFNEENKETLIVDPGGEPAKIKSIVDELTAVPLAILLTHTHYDHIGAVDEIRDYYDIPVYVAAKEQQWLSEPNKKLSALLGQAVTARAADYLFEPEETIEIADFTIKVVATPGHSPGGVSFIFEEDEFVITGDALFAGSIGRTALPGSQPEQLFKGIREKWFILPDQYTASPGHGPQTNIGNEKKPHPFCQQFSSTTETSHTSPR